MDGPRYRSHIRGGKGCRKVHMEMLSLHLYIHIHQLLVVYIKPPPLSSPSLSLLSFSSHRISIPSPLVSQLPREFPYPSSFRIYILSRYIYGPHIHFFIFCQSNQQSLHQDAVSHTRFYHRGQPREPRCRDQLPRYNIAASGRDRLHTRHGGGHIHHHRN